LKNVLIPQPMDPDKEDVGASFEWVISAKQVHSMDECEQILLQTDYEALRDVLAHHLSTVSQQYIPPGPWLVAPPGEILSTPIRMNIAYHDDALSFRFTADGKHIVAQGRNQRRNQKRCADQPALGRM